MSQFSLYVSNLPNGTSLDDLIIYFQSGKSGGGDVNNYVSKLDNNNAVIVFEKNEGRKCDLFVFVLMITHIHLFSYRKLFSFYLKLNFFRNSEITFIFIYYDQFLHTFTFHIILWFSILWQDVLIWLSDLKMI